MYYCLLLLFSRSKSPIISEGLAHDMNNSVQIYLLHVEIWDYFTRNQRNNITIVSACTFTGYIKTLMCRGSLTSWEIIMMVVWWERNSPNQLRLQWKIYESWHTCTSTNFTGPVHIQRSHANILMMTIMVMPQNILVHMDPFPWGAQDSRIHNLSPGKQSIIKFILPFLMTEYVRWKEVWVSDLHGMSCFSSNNQWSVQVWEKAS